MSVIRPKPPTDPIHHRPPIWAGGEGEARRRAYREWVTRLEGHRHDAAAALAAATPLLAAYGTLRAPADRRASALFALLDVAREVRDTVDRVVVVGDGPHRTPVDLLLATCCHPFHDQLPRSERGGRPRFVVLSPDDDDDRVQGTLDLLASRGGDRLADAWGLVVVGAASEPRAGALAHLFARLGRTRSPGAGTLAPAAVSARVVAGEAAALEPGPACRELLLPGVGGAAAAGCFTALLPAAIAGIDVVRVLEGMAAMERRFAEAASEANPVVTFVAAGRAVAPPGEVPRRALLTPRHWPGLDEWAAALGGRRSMSPSETRVATSIVVEACRRRPFGDGEAPHPPSSGPGIDAIALPTADEHTVGQLLALLRLAAHLDGLAG